MTQPKILTPQEALRALADGKKLTCGTWEAGTYFHLKDGAIKNEKGDFVRFHSFHSCYEYTEPRPKRKVAPYLVKFVVSGYLEQTRGYFRDEAEVMAHFLGVARVEILRRVTELECEIEV